MSRGILSSIQNAFNYYSDRLLEPEKRGWIIYWATLPENAIPAELLAQFPTEEWQVDSKGRATFRLKLGRLSGDSSGAEGTAHLQISKVSRESLVGTYSAFGKYLELKADGSCLLSEPASNGVSQGKWEIVPILRRGSSRGYIEGDAIVVGGDKLWVKQNDAKLIMHTDSRESIWSEYTQEENVKQGRPSHLRLDKNGTFTMSLKGNWKVKGNSITWYHLGEKTESMNLRVEGDTLIFPDEGGSVRKAHWASPIKKTKKQYFLESLCLAR